MTPISDQKPSAEVQAIVMNLWNVVRENAQATAAVHTENKAFAQKYQTLAEQMQQEHERHAKLQAYTEHLQAELKQCQHDLDVLQPQFQEALEVSKQREETIQELRRILNEQEELVARRNEENKTLSEQLALASEGLNTEREHLQISLEALKHDLTASRQQSLDVATEVDELRAEIETLSTERDNLLDDNEQLRWRLEAFEKNSSQERLELEQKLEAARVYSGEVTARLEDAKRLTSESDARISALANERNGLRDSLEKVEQDALTWQQIAEEQTEAIERVQALEKELKTSLEQHRAEYAASISSQFTASKNLHETALEALKVQLHEERIQRQEALEAYTREHEQIIQLTSSKNLYETVLENLKTQLQEERIQHQQTLAAHADEHEQAVSALEEQITTLRAEFDKQMTELRRGAVHLGDEDRLALMGTITHLLERVEMALVEHEE